MNELFVAMAQIAKSVSTEVKKPQGLRAQKDHKKELRIGTRIIAMLKRRPRSRAQIEDDLNIPNLDPRRIEYELRDLVDRKKIVKRRHWTGYYNNSGRKRYVVRYSVPK